MGRHYHNKLTPREVTTVNRDGFYHDGGGLYLQVRGTAKSWIFRFKVDGRDRQMGLGPLHTVGLAEARDLAFECRRLRLKWIDPIEHRNAERLAARKEAAKQVTFDACAEEYFERNAGGWRSQTLKVYRERYENYLKPKLGNILINSIDVDLCENVIGDLWKRIPYTGQRSKELLSYILDWAEDKGYRPQNSNPAKGPLTARLKPIDSVHKRKHFAALPYREVGALMMDCRNVRYNWRYRIRDILTALKQAESMTTKQVTSAIGVSSVVNTRVELNSMVRAGLITRIKPGTFQYSGGQEVLERPAERPLLSYVLEFLILTTVRSHQVIGLPWDEIKEVNVPHKHTLWICPPERHKTGKWPHVVPLSKQAIAVLAAMRAQQQAEGITSNLVFVQTSIALPPGRSLAVVRKPVHESSLLQFLQDRLDRPDLTVHGFRSTFASWSVDHGYDERDSEMALAHTIGVPVRNIYKRNAYRLEPRTLMMQAWADYCDRTEPLPAEVVPFKQAKDNR